MIRGDHDSASALAKRLYEMTGDDPIALAYMRDQARLSGQYPEAQALYLKAYPQLFAEKGPEVSNESVGAAIDLVPVLRATGNAERADLLLEQALDLVNGRPRRGVWRGINIIDVEILTLQGRHMDALATLREAVGSGWRTLWNYYLLYEPNLQPLRDYPEFQAVLNEIEADMAAQLERIREMEREGEIDPIPNRASLG